MSSDRGSAEPSFTPDVLEQAGAWDARLRAPDCSDDDRSRFAAWRDADPARRSAFEKLQLMVGTLRQERGRADVRALRDEALRAVGERKRRRLWSALAAAAAGVIGLGISTALWRAPAGWLQRPLDEVVGLLTRTERYETGVGQRSTFVLEDGSSIELNAESRVVVAFTAKRRSVELIRGQALFSVAKNPDRPFVVQAGNRQVVAVGTQFDVRLDTHTVRVTLIEGKVRVVPAKGTSLSSSGQVDAGIVLTPGKQLTARLDRPSFVDVATAGDRRPSHKVSTIAPESAHPVPTQAEAQSGDNTVRDIDVAKATSWRTGRIFLDDLSLADAISEMNRYSPVQITVDDPRLAQLHVNGMFRAGEQDAFVNALEQYFPISAERRGDHSIILTARR